MASAKLVERFECTQRDLSATFEAQMDGINAHFDTLNTQHNVLIVLLSVVLALKLFGPLFIPWLGGN